jgi:hypothetical protein
VVVGDGPVFTGAAGPLVEGAVYTEGATGRGLGIGVPATAAGEKGAPRLVVSSR